MSERCRMRRPSFWKRYRTVHRPPELIWSAFDHRRSGWRSCRDRERPRTLVTLSIPFFAVAVPVLVTAEVRRASVPADKRCRVASLGAITMRYTHLPSVRLDKDKKGFDETID